MSRNEQLHSQPTVPGFSVTGFLGSGTFGDVYRVRPNGAGKERALKVLNPWMSQNAEIREKFEIESERLTSFSHHNIVRGFGTVETSSGQPALLMELMNERTLEQYIKRKTHFSKPSRQRLALGVVQQLGAALDYLHIEQQVAHLDVRPSNIFITRSRGVPQVKLGDLGIAMHTDGSSTAVTGCTRYSSPELKGFIPVKMSELPKSDIYSLCVLAIELLDQFPHESHRSEHGPWVNRIRQPTADVFLKGLAENPADRHASASVLAESLRDAIDSRQSRDLLFHAARFGAVGLGLGGISILGIRSLRKLFETP